MTGGLDRLHPVIVHHLVNSLGWKELRPLQDYAISPLLDGQDALLLAPTAGGKTEAAIFPLLTAMEAQRWEAGPSVIYVAPLKALLNNLLPRLKQYASWLGRRAAIWHGDVTAAARQRILRDPPDLLLTTPESLEAMLISIKTDPPRLFGMVRAVVVDEVWLLPAQPIPARYQPRLQGPYITDAHPCSASGMCQSSGAPWVARRVNQTGDVPGKLSTKADGPPGSCVVV